MKPTQKQLIKLYLDEHGSITPARLCGTPYLNGFFGAEISKRCREMRAEGLLRSEPDEKRPKFEKFMFIKKEANKLF